ncbi:DNA (cytosine-5-)-methyltransferase [Campylobacter sp. LR291e]|uniref:DNA (cytosine-5-)-methyltransferase n=1 Tax=unclassified Campylobacter TaxID=2593542 RepID=UPI001237DFD6|nr:MULTISPECIES: DNA (cytosine-5-)-methyltransferase [unclassified Campylobacter]KAA6227844.1 DNA (cytosine-5-)-methyltransferase [Campylobacter sp. LR185c]KAA6228252.1 DNA (cytosine-5-)-methyltransferase [Campylobacter sp. LR196d]KAA6229252.1 DNA (cytosine-5-)-methyltransferase [Campylobacter sp. LR291e]KAA6231058.1 DNA (cytosine-5-)-methyltransferase [Campylobacter sp. LR264d]KAA8604468.1 DNA (cytosine-5-)-methyltransferase [Campylobacter sp. LR185c]
MTFIDFCSGIGGGRLGLTLNGFKCLGFSEIDKEAIKTYKSFFDTTNELEFGDITSINPKFLPDFDLLISGFPCQSFSIVGKREGLENTQKGQIVYYLAKILQIKQPKFFILENVKGLINHNEGKTLKIILELLENCGYKVSYRLINSLNFNLPQSRERIYFIGIRNNLNKKFYFEAPSILKEVKLNDFLSPSKKNIFDKNTTNYQTFLAYLENKYNKKKFGNKINLNDILKENYLVLDTRQSDLRLYRNNFPTLRRDRQGILYVFNKNLYKLNGLEALKLQGFDKIEKLEYKISNLSQNNLLKQCGNAMSVNVIENLAYNIKKING